MRATACKSTYSPRVCTYLFDACSCERVISKSTEELFPLSFLSVVLGKLVFSDIPIDSP